MSVSTPTGITFEDFFNRIIPAVFLHLVVILVDIYGELMSSFETVATIQSITRGEFTLIFTNREIRNTESYVVLFRFFDLSSVEYLLLFTYLLLVGGLITQFRERQTPLPASLTNLFENIHVNNIKNDQFSVLESDTIGQKETVSTISLIFEYAATIHSILMDVQPSYKSIRLTSDSEKLISDYLKQDVPILQRVKTASEQAELFYYITEPTVSNRTKRYELVCNFYYNLRMLFIIGYVCGIPYSFYYSFMLADITIIQIIGRFLLFLLVLSSNIYCLFVLVVLSFQEAEHNYVRALILEYRADRQVNAAIETKGEEDPRLHTNYANLLADQDRPDEAEEHYRQALELRGEDADNEP